MDGVREFESSLTRRAVQQSLQTDCWINYGEEAPNLKKIPSKFQAKYVLHRVVKKIGARVVADSYKIVQSVNEKGT